MPDAFHYRQEAKRHRALAEAEQNPELANQFLSFARDCDILASLVDEAEGNEAAPPPPIAPVQRQPMQQQQQKKKEDEK